MFYNMDSNTIGQSSIQHIYIYSLNQMNITQEIFLNLYHFSSTLVLFKYQDLFREQFLNPAYLAELS